MNNLALIFTIKSKEVDEIEKHALGHCGGNGWGIEWRTAAQDSVGSIQHGHLQASPVR